MRREVACEEISFIVNLVIEKSVYKLPLKASAKIAFANFQNRFLNPLISVPELGTSISALQMKRKFTPKHKFVCKVFKRE